MRNSTFFRVFAGCHFECPEVKRNAYFRTYREGGLALVPDKSRYSGTLEPVGLTGRLTGTQSERLAIKSLFIPVSEEPGELTVEPVSESLYQAESEIKSFHVKEFDTKIHPEAGNYRKS